MPSGRGGREIDSRDVDLLAAEEAHLWIPGKPDHDLPLERVPCGRGAEPRRTLRGRDVRLLTYALRPDHDVGQVEPDIREGREQLGVEAACAVVALPAVAGLDELIDAVRRERGDQAVEVACVLGQRVRLVELSDLAIELRRDLAAVNLEHGRVGHGASLSRRSNQAATSSVSNSSGA